MPRKKLKKARVAIKRIHEDEKGWAMNLSNYGTTKQAAETVGVRTRTYPQVDGTSEVEGNQVGT